MAKTPIGFYKKDGITRPITARTEKRRSNFPRPTKLTRASSQANSFKCRKCGTYYSEESGAYSGFTCEDCTGAPKPKIVKITVEDGVVQDVKGLPRGGLYDLIDEDESERRRFKLGVKDVGIRVRGGAVSEVKLPPGYSYQVIDKDE